MLDNRNRNIKRKKIMKLLFALLSLVPVITLGQASSDVILMIDLEKIAWYALDPADSAKWMTSPNPTPVPSTFISTPMTHLLFADVVAINGKPAKGTFAAWGIWTSFSQQVLPAPGRPIADISRSQIWNMLFEVHDVEKGQVGTLAAVGFASGPAPPGSARGSVAGNFVITGGSGAWSGARGQAATVSIAGTRIASGVENPAYRRINSAGTWRIAATLHSMAIPTVIAAYHLDFIPVSASNPARPGETLILAVKGLGATNPVLMPGKTFDEKELAIVAAPVTATVNDLPAAVGNQIGWPGTSDTFRVDATLPGEITGGVASVSISAAWIAGPELKIPVRPGQ